MKIKSQIIIKSYLSLIIGMLTQLAAATAQNGTNLPINGEAFLTKLFKPSAVVKAPPVANP